MITYSREITCSYTNCRTQIGAGELLFTLREGSYVKRIHSNDMVDTSPGAVTLEPSDRDVLRMRTPEDMHFCCPNCLANWLAGVFEESE